MKLALGTAQFGLNYGVANVSGQLTSSEGAAILDCARRAGIDTIDTAVAYGSSEQVLGGLGVDGWRVVSKLPVCPTNLNDAARWVDVSIDASLGRLRIPSLYGLLLHRSQDLLCPYGADLYRALYEAKLSGRVRRIGISVYDPAELDALLRKFTVDLVQVPFNVLDRRVKTSGWLMRLKDQGIEVHARSAFLQGLLLMTVDRRPARFSRWQTLWVAWDRWLEETGQTALQACLGFVLSEQDIAEIVVGVDSAHQLREILTAAAAPPHDPPPAHLMTDDIELLHPSQWRLA